MSHATLPDAPAVDPTGAATDASRPHPGVTGLHHVALVTRDAGRAARFYGDLLGLVDLGDSPLPVAASERPGQVEVVPARWFAAGAARPGALVAIVERPDALAGAPGIGGSHHFALAVGDRAALLRWKRRFVDAGVAVNGILDRHYFQSIYVRDPDGQIVELATVGPGWTIDEDALHLGEAHRDPPAEMVNTNRDRARIAAEQWPEPVPALDDAMRIPGLHHVTAIGASIEATDAFVRGRLGMRRVKRTNNFDDVGSFHWYWGVGDGAPGTLVTYFDRRPERERPVRMGAGQLAHYAVSVTPSSRDTLDALAAALSASGRLVSPEVGGGPAAAPFRAVATTDPDGHPVLLATPDDAAVSAHPAHPSATPEPLA